MVQEQQTDPLQRFLPSLTCNVEMGVRMNSETLSKWLPDKLSALRLVSGSSSPIGSPPMSATERVEICCTCCGWRGE